MRFLSLFAGIGGFDLGLERSGFECVGQVEIEPFCQKVLAKHWPNVWRWNDVKTLTGETVKQNCGTVDLLCGGVPCQPASVAGKRLGTADDRWLWPEFLRLVSEVRPVWVLAENPRGVLSIDVDGVQFSEWIAREFAARGYELFPVELAAEDVGAPYRRERIFFVGRWVADAKGQQNRRLQFSGLEANAGRAGELADADSIQQQQPGGIVTESRQWIGDGGEKLDDARCVGLEAGRIRSQQTEAKKVFNDQPERTSATSVANANNARLEERGTSGINGIAGGRTSAAIAGSGYQWPSRPGQPQHDWEEPRTTQLQVGESASGISVRLAGWHRVSALKALGNAIVPQCAEVIGRAILQMESL